MKIKNALACVMLLLGALSGKAQFKRDSVVTAPAPPATDKPSITVTENRQLMKRKGKFFMYWGYNRAAFSKSDIRFKDVDYDFTIKDVRAKDQPEPFSNTYYKLSTFSIPQYNYRLGYYINDKTYISIGEDHMKYAIEKQTTRISGTISKDNNGGANVGTYDNVEVIVGEDGENLPLYGTIADSLKGGFVTAFEHCDGLNDVTIELGRTEQLWISRNGKHALAFTGSIGGGVVIPDSDTDVLGYDPRHDAETGKKSYHLAGYSGSALLGLEFTFFRNFFLLGRLKGGYMNLPDIMTTVEGGRASQHFRFLESALVVGYSYKFGKK